MKVQFFLWLKGAVQVQIKGDKNDILSYMNLALKKGIYMYDVVTISDNIVQATIVIRDVFKLISFRKKYQVTLSFKKRVGFPFFMMRLFTRMGLIVGLFCFFLTVYLCSQLIWDIKIVGGSASLQHEMEGKLKSIGVEKGRFFRDSTNPSLIQHTLMDEMDHLIWVGVQKKGTILYFQPVEKKIKEKEKTPSPQHIVATKKAVVYDIFAKEGQPLVSIHELVTQGQVLISGMIGKEGNETFVAAQGIVYGEIWYKTEIEVPLQSSFSVLREERVVKHGLHIGQDYMIPIWGFWYDTKKKAQSYENVKSWKWGGKTIPISLHTEEIYETEKVIRTYTKKEAVEAGLIMAKEQLQRSLPKNSQIKNEKVLHEHYANGKVKLIIHYLVIEPISKEQTITEEIE